MRRPYNQFSLFLIDGHSRLWHSPNQQNTLGVSLSHGSFVLVRWQPRSNLVAAPTFTLFFQVCYSSVIRFNIEEQSNNNTITIERLICLIRRNSEANPCLSLCCWIANIDTFVWKFKKQAKKKWSGFMCRFPFSLLSDDAFCRKVLEFKQLAIYRQFFFINLSIRLCFKYYFIDGENQVLSPVEELKQ